MSQVYYSSAQTDYLGTILLLITFDLIGMIF